MRITVLGTSPSWQNAGGACSGYLVEDGETCLLVDCGSGVFSRLRGVRDYVEVDAIVVTHVHADHVLDLIPFAGALTYGPRGPRADPEDRPRDVPPARPRLAVPGGARERLRQLAGADGRPELIETAFDLTEYDAEGTLREGSLQIDFQPVPHYVPCNAVRVRGSSGGRFTFGADHGPTDALDDFARDSDLLVLEATLKRAGGDGERGHLTAGEAGEHAARCNARRLLLTHISDELDWDRALAEARRSFGGPVEIAREGESYEL